MDLGVVLFSGGCLGHDSCPPCLVPLYPLVALYPPIPPICSLVASSTHPTHHLPRISCCEWTSDLFCGWLSEPFCVRVDKFFFCGWTSDPPTVSRSFPKLACSRFSGMFAKLVSGSVKSLHREQRSRLPGFFLSASWLWKLGHSKSMH